MADETQSAGQDPSTVDGEDDDQNKLISVWKRWYGPPDQPFHHYCDFFPERPATNDEDTRHDPEIYYVPEGGFPRMLLRYTPLVILTSVLLVFISAEYSAVMRGLSNYVTIPFTDVVGLQSALLLLFGIAWVLMLIVLLDEAEVLPGKESVTAVVTYTLGLVLFGGVAFSIFRAYSALALGAADPQVTGEFGDVMASMGLWLTLLVGGHLVYDMMLRTENMFSRLADKDPPIIGPVGADRNNDDYERRVEAAQNAYESEFLSEFGDVLDSRLYSLSLPWQDGEYHVRTANVFGVLFVAPFFVSGYVLIHGSLQAGARVLLTNPADLIIALVPTILIFVNVVVFFQFIVVVTNFHKLLTKHSPDTEEDVEFKLEYQPHHPDGYAGFRDLGRFATRINSLLVLGGLYLVNRFYAAGLLTMPETSSPFTPEMIRWLFQQIGPMATYLLAVVIWLYLSFWQIHKAMRRGRERSIQTTLENNEGELPDPSLKNAPVWPLNTGLFLGILIGDLLPLLSVLPVFM